MQNKESKRASICQVYFMAIAESTVTNIPGLPQIKVIGDWAKMDYSTVEFAEDKSSDGNSYEVNLSITFSDSSLEKMRELMAWDIHSCAIRLYRWYIQGSRYGSVPGCIILVRTRFSTFFDFLI